MNKNRLWFGIFVLLAFTVGLSFGNTTLSVGNGLESTGNWTTASLTYDVTWDSSKGLWFYNYELTTPTPATSHFTLEVSETFTVLDNLFNPSKTLDGTDYPTNIGPSPSNPEIPGTFYGLKFTASDELIYTLTFYSDRDPVFGDFYAKGGNNSAVWNIGFLTGEGTGANDMDSSEWHILVPDSTVHSPAPGALILGSIGAGLLGWLRRRRIF